MITPEFILTTTCLCGFLITIVIIMWDTTSYDYTKFNKLKLHLFKSKIILKNLPLGLDMQKMMIFHSKLLNHINDIISLNITQKYFLHHINDQNINENSYNEFKIQLYKAKYIAEDILYYFQTTTEFFYKDSDILKLWFDIRQCIDTIINLDSNLEFKLITVVDNVLKEHINDNSDNDDSETDETKPTESKIDESKPTEAETNYDEIYSTNVNIQNTVKLVEEINKKTSIEKPHRKTKWFYLF